MPTNTYIMATEWLYVCAVIVYCRCLILLFVYIIGGILVLRYWRGARGLEQIPNYEFWKSLPGLVKVCLISNCCSFAVSWKTQFK